MNSIKKLLTCKICDNILNNTPVILSCCDATVCSSHLDFFLNNNTLYTCELCNHTHDNQKSKIFVSNKLAEDLLKMKFEKLNFGRKHEKAKEECEELKFFLTEIKDLINEPKNYIHECVSELKNDIDIRREEIKLEIDEMSDDMIERLELFEKECYENLSNESIQNRIIKFNQDIYDIEAKLNEWTNELNMLIIDTDKWDKIQSTVSFLYEQLDSSLDSFKDDLVLQKFWKLEPRLNFQDEFNKELNLYERNRTIKLDLNNFEELFRFEKDTYILSPVKIFGDYSWYIGSKTTKKEDNEYYLDFVLFCMPQNPNKFPVTVNAKFNILHLENPNYNFSRILISLYKQFEGRGYDKLIKIKDIMNPENGYYNPKTDKVTIEVEFYFIN